MNQTTIYVAVSSNGHRHLDTASSDKEVTLATAYSLIEDWGQPGDQIVEFYIVSRSFHFPKGKAWDNNLTSRRRDRFTLVEGGRLGLR